MFPWTWLAYQFGKKCHRSFEFSNTLFFYLSPFDTRSPSSSLSFYNSGRGNYQSSSVLFEKLVPNYRANYYFLLFSNFSFLVVFGVRTGLWLALGGEGSYCRCPQGQRVTALFYSYLETITFYYRKLPSLGQFYKRLVLFHSVFIKDTIQVGIPPVLQIIERFALSDDHSGHHGVQLSRK